MTFIGIYSIVVIIAFVGGIGLIKYAEWDEKRKK